MNVRVALGIGLLAISLYACSPLPSNQGETTTAPVAPPAWTDAEIAAKGIIDLSELGTMSYDAKNQAYINKRLVPDTVLGSYPYTLGNAHVNILHVDAATLATLPDGLAAALLNASPADIHRYADRYGLDREALRTASFRGDLSSKQFYSILGAAKNSQVLKLDLSTRFQGVKATAFMNTIDQAERSAE